MILTMPFAALAQHVVSPGCDPVFFDVMEARSTMEGQQDVEVAERLILKPDSVLEYSCFNDSVNNLSVFIGGGLGAVSGAIVTNSLASYLGNNFGHTYAGGASGPPGAPGPTCNAMAAVWHFLKCNDFDRNHFLSMAEMPANDIRVFPTTCPNPAARTANWNAMIGAAFPAPANPSVNGSIDAVTHYNDQIIAGPCGASTVIPTGVIVGGTAPFPDAVCSVPGCYYDGSGGCN